MGKCRSKEIIRLEGYMDSHKAIVKEIIRSRRFEIISISEPWRVRGKENGKCYLRIVGYPTEGSVEAVVYEENKRMFERFCSTKKAQYKYRKDKANWFGKRDQSDRFDAEESDE